MVGVSLLKKGMGRTSRLDPGLLMVVVVVVVMVVVVIVVVVLVAVWLKKMADRDI